MCGDGLITPLPLTITYTTEAELRELEKLRMRVALLQQEIYLEQVRVNQFIRYLIVLIDQTVCSVV